MQSVWSTLITRAAVISAFAGAAGNTGAGYGRKTPELTWRRLKRILPKRERVSLQNSTCCCYFGLDCNGRSAWWCFSRLGDNKEKKCQDAARGKQRGDDPSHCRPPSAHSKYLNNYSETGGVRTTGTPGNKKSPKQSDVLKPVGRSRGAAA
jgi:hypothetical protein